MNSSIISECGQYRYALSRPGPAMDVVIGLNPSTACASKDDPTIRRLYGFLPNGFIVLNLYALRSTDPAALWQHPDPVGPDNDFYLRFLCAAAPRVIVAWGTNAKPERAAQVVAMLDRPLFCFGRNQGHTPKHPLYLARTVEIQNY